MTKYLQLRVHRLRCVRETQNRQNFMGIPLEIDPDSIDVQALVVDGGEGVVAQGPTVFLGNKYRDGREERFSPPKVLAEIPVRDDDVFPRRVKVSLNMAEKDDGGGFDELMSKVATTLAGELTKTVRNQFGSEVTSSEIYGEVENTAVKFLQAVLHEIGKALGLGDDPFVPVDISVQLASATADVSSAEQQVRFREPNPVHKGEFLLTYSWGLVNAPTLQPASQADPNGGARMALTGVDGYGRAHRIHRFRNAVRKQPARGAVVAKPVQVAGQTWYPTPIRLMSRG